MRFLDCNLSYGPDVPDTCIRGCPDIGALKERMARSGLSGGWVTHTLGEPIISNSLVAADLAGEPNLKGVWRLLPSATGEIPSPADLPRRMSDANIAALTLCPAINRFMPAKVVIGDYLTMASERKIPVVLNTSRGITLEQAAAVLSEFPGLTCVMTFANCWPSDRYIRPLCLAYHRVYLDISYMITDCGLKDILKTIPPERILYGSGYPECYMGANMMMVKHAEIGETEKYQIAGGNLKRLEEEACYD